MSTLYIAEFSRLGLAPRGGAVQSPEETPIAEQTVVIGAGSVQSAALNANTSVVRLHSDVVCAVAFGSSPTATAANRRMAAGQTEYFTVDRMSPAVKKYAVITTT